MLGTNYRILWTEFLATSYPQMLMGLIPESCCMMAIKRAIIPALDLIFRRMECPPQSWLSSYENYLSCFSFSLKSSIFYIYTYSQQFYLQSFQMSLRAADRSPMLIKYLGVQQGKTQRRTRVCMVTVIRGNPKTNTHIILVSLSQKCVANRYQKIQAKATPPLMNICGMEPITPAISVGAIYRMIKGDMVMQHPTQAPCINLPRRRVQKFYMKITIPANKAKEFVISIIF